MSRLAIVLMVACAVPILSAHMQEPPEGVFDRAFEAAVKSAAPEFRPHVTLVHTQQDFHYREWRSGDRRVSVKYFIRDSAESAERLLNDRVAVSSIPARRVEGFGDEAYLTADYKPTGDRQLRFRRLTTVVEVTAPGEEAVRRFASVFLIEITNSGGRGRAARTCAVTRDKVISNVDQPVGRFPH